LQNEIEELKDKLEKLKENDSNNFYYVKGILEATKIVEGEDNGRIKNENE